MHRPPSPEPGAHRPSLLGLRVFMSYPRGGATHTWAELVRDDLQARGAEVWFDLNKVAEGEEDWYKRTEQNLTRAHAVAFILGADSEGSRWQKREMLMADKLALPVVAFRTAAVALPFYAIEKQPVELREDRPPEASFTLLADALALVAVRPPAVVPVAVAPAPNLEAQRRHELEFLSALLFGDLSDREARYEPLAGHERASASLARSHKGLRTDLTSLLRHFHQPEQPAYDAAPTPWADVLDAYRSLPGRSIRRLAVLGEPGAGKTFSLERIAAHHARQALESAAAPVPLLVRLGGWTKEGMPLQAFIESTLGVLGPHFTALRDQRRAVLLLDGLNEIPPGQRRLKADELRRLAEDERFAAVVLSCRERDYEADYTLPFDTLVLQPLTPPQIHRFLHRAYAFNDGPERGAALAEARFWEIAGGQALRDVWATWERAGASLELFWSADDVPLAEPDVQGATTGQQDGLWRRARQDSRALMRLAGNPYLLFVMTALPAIPRNRAALFDGFLAHLHERERKARDERHDGRSVPPQPHWLAVLTEVAEALQRLQPVDVDAGAQTEAAGSTGAATALPRSEWPASLTPALLDFSIDASVLQRVGDDLRFTHQLLQEALASRVLQQASTEGSTAANRFWPADRWWKRSGWEVVAEIAAEACAADAPALWQLLGWLADANPEVACEAWRRTGAPALPAEFARAVAHRWLPRLTDARAEPAPAARAAIGRALGGFDLDHRPGVGLRADGLPDIHWVTIPGGRPFIYQHGEKLTLPTFQIARYPVTHRQFQAFIDAGGYVDKRWWKGLAQRVDGPAEPSWREPNAPRETVSWYEAVAYTRWLGAALGCAVSLPTEHQWERVARGLAGAEYPWGKGYAAGCANCDEPASDIAGGTRVGRTTAVGIYPFAGSEEVHDLAGNVWEWCLNEHEHSERLSISGRAARALRGGSWLDSARYLRASDRGGVVADGRNGSIGFRVCRVSPEVNALLTNARASRRARGAA